MFMVDFSLCLSVYLGRYTSDISLLLNTKRCSCCSIAAAPAAARCSVIILRVLLPPPPLQRAAAMPILYFTDAKMRCVPPLHANGPSGLRLKGQPNNFTNTKRMELYKVVVRRRYITTCCYILITGSMTLQMKPADENRPETY